MKPRILAIVHKEFIHIFRDPRSLVIVFLMPILMILMYGYAITFDIKEINVGVLDQDGTSASRELVQGLTSSNYFKTAARLNSRSDIESAFMSRRIIAALVIPVDFAKQLQNERVAPVQLIVDGSNANTATVASNYLKSFLTLYSLDINEQVLRPPVQLQPRVWYNPDLKSAHFFVPGLVAVIMMMICALLTSVTIARERETGTIEQILVSPIRPYEIVFGKVTPYVLISLLDSALVIVFSMIIFSVPFRGQPVLLLMCAIAYVYAALSQGIFISARVKTQQIALMMAMLSSMLPSFLLSGFIFPIASMPYLLRLVSYAVSARYFLIIIRGVMLKGIGYTYLYVPTLFLIGFGTLLLIMSVNRFKTSLEG